MRRSQKTVFMLLLTTCLFLAFEASAQPNRTISSFGTISQGNFVDKWITWDDGTKEHVQIGKDGYFVLNDAKRKLVGFEIGTTGLQGAFWDSDDLAIVEKELTYLQSMGIRLITLDLFYVGKDNEQSRYSPILNLLRFHKMFVFAVITGKGEGEFDSLSVLDFPISTEYGDDTMGNWTKRWLDVVKSYDNVVAISVENEMDYPLSGQEYTNERVSAYMKWLIGLIKAETELPLTSKLIYQTNVRLDLKSAVLAEVDFPTCTAYAFNLTSHDHNLGRWKTFLSQNNRSIEGWWVAELNKKTAPDGESDWDCDTPNFAVEYIDAVFNNGASVAVLFPMNRYQRPSWAFFDIDGNPTDMLLTLAGNFSRLQAPLS